MGAVILQFIAMKDMPNRIRYWRKLRGMTLETLGERVGFTHTQISNLERGMRQLNLATMRKIARELGCAPADLLNDGDAGLRLDAEEAALIDELRATGTSAAAVRDVARAFRPQPRAPEENAA